MNSIEDRLIKWVIIAAIIYFFLHVLWLSWTRQDPFSPFAFIAACGALILGFVLYKTVAINKKLTIWMKFGIFVAVVIVYSLLVAVAAILAGSSWVWSLVRPFLEVVV